MEYKIGQRVKANAGGEFYIDSYDPMRDEYRFVDRHGAYKCPLPSSCFSAYYKPGDPVRVKSRDELDERTPYPGYMHEDWYSFADKVVTLDRFNGVNWNIKEDEHCCYGVEDFAWYSEPDKLPEPEPGMNERAKEFLEANLPEGKPDVQLYPNSETSNYDVLIAEIHQDKDRNRAALAEVLKIQETSPQLWKCPYYDKHTHRPCNETGSKHDIRQHSKTAHGEALPPTNSPVWEHWRVS